VKLFRRCRSHYEALEHVGKPVNGSRRAETLRQGERWGSAQTKTRAEGILRVPESLLCLIVAGGGGNWSISGDLMSGSAQDSMAGYEGVFYTT